MLALTRKKNEAIIISGGIEIKVLDIQGDKVKLGIKAPKSVDVYREEVYKQIKENNKEAVQDITVNLDELKQLIKK
ncbi:carbon storage regulator CsrA [Cellulosilyticum lentocellum]|uniref:Translational regulator CsrA n=1 Tax=Cellulosilyticum lentocellum (strain ATCC 49066 / DSM 5427 / NCIMB 11756 / RHM5) TaxID=642492 RepID=F2JT56_CELLD|nr:carbon storage regulator CsrA [Cellulosilyticum lentocellum]ADZ85275.1 carbon storage regulator, CsrA [Cellulosilyticum lentocellum DSM 5427]